MTEQEPTADEANTNLLIEEGREEEEEDSPGQERRSSSEVLGIPRRTMVGITLRVAATGVFLLYIVYLALPGSSLFSWHPTLMTLAFTGLMTEAVSMFGKGGLGTGRPHSTKVTLHWALLAAVGAAHGVGYATIYIRKEQEDKPHLTSWHGCLGLATSLFLWLQLSAGIFSLYPKLTRNFVSLKVLRAGHSFSGCVTYVLGATTMCVGLWTHWYQRNAAFWSVYPAVALHMVLVFMVCKRHFQRYMWRPK